jgi:hypothetical protein
MVPSFGTFAPAATQFLLTGAFSGFGFGLWLSQERAKAKAQSWLWRSDQKLAKVSQSHLISDG